MTVDRSVITKSTNGIFANGTAGTVLVEVKDSTIANNNTHGVWSFTGGSQSVVVLDRSASVQNGSSGVVAG